MRGLRNNNPLNIRHSADRWKGAREEQTDRSFVQFTTMAYGYRAAWKTLDTYSKRFKREKKLFNVRNIIARWAPPSENDTEAYVRTVVRLTSLGGNESLPRPYHGYMLDKMVRLLAAMTVVECGIPIEQVDINAIWEGYDLAFPGKRYTRAGHIRSTEPLMLTPYQLPQRDPNSTFLWDEYWDWCAPSLTCPSEDDV